MLRINLLPTYVSQRKLTRKIIMGGSLLAVVSVGLPLFLWYQANQSKEHWLSEAQTAEAGKAITDKAKSDAAATRAQIAPLLAKVKYVKDVHQHNNDIVNFWSTVAEYSDPKVIYSDASVSGTTLTMKAYTPSIAEIGRYLQAMYSEPDFTSVGIDKLPGYPEALVGKYYLNNKLIAIDSAPSQSGGGNGGGGGKPTGGLSAGVSNGGGSGFGGGGFGGNAGRGNTNNSQSGVWDYGQTGPIGPTNVPVIGSTTGNNGPNGSSGAGGGQVDTQKLAQILLADPQFKAVALNPFAPPTSQFQAVFNLIKKIKVRHEPQGFPVTITATLKQPLVVPALPGTAAATTGPGGLPAAGMPSPGAYPGAAGYPGGMSGYPGGGYPGGPPRG